jgi:predicted  nucleic acid-binding Zn-ribbon protein
MAEETSSQAFERLVRLERDMQHVQEMLEGISRKIDSAIELKSAVQVLENKDAQHREAMSRAFQRVEALEKEVRDLQTCLDRATAKFQGAVKALGVVAGVVGLLGIGGLAKLFGILS